MAPVAPYRIVENSRKRKILVVSRMLNAAHQAEVEKEEFDAIFVNMVGRTYEETRMVSRWLSPVRSGKTFLKPRFANYDLRNFMRQDHVVAHFDGLCSNPLDENFANRIEQIYSNMHKYGIDPHSFSEIYSTSKLLSNLVKYDISRGRLTFSSHAVRGLAQGFSKTYLLMYDDYETLQIDERMKFVLKLEELGYAVRGRLIDRIHVCHECGDSHQLFVECCPKCNSSDIHQESMIHHFRCANISPETKYFKNGELVCPKCRRVLRHIGVDYDRPATIHSCNCGNTFLQPAMKVVCTSCLKETSPEELTPIDVYEYTLTPAGIKAFATDEAIFQIESTDLYSGRSTFENFCESIHVFQTMPTYEDYGMLVFRYHYTYEGDKEDTHIYEIMRAIMMRNSTVKLTTNDNNIYMMYIAPQNKLDEEYDFAKQNLDKIFQDHNEENSEFEGVWLKTYKLLHDDDPHEFIKQLSEVIEDRQIEEIQEEASGE